MKTGQRVIAYDATLLVSLCVALCLSGCASPPAVPEVSGRALASLSLGTAALLPSSAISSPPGVPPVEEVLDQGQSFSLGTTSHGRLMHGISLPVDHTALRPRPVSQRRRAVHGTRDLIEVLERVATRVARGWPGSQLFAGDVSAEDGGDIPHHVSHNSGRDVDLAFYMRGAGGRIQDSSSFLKVAADGRAMNGSVAFDVPRNWALIEGLVRDPHVQVQWIFVVQHLKDRLMEHGLTVGADATVLDRARRVLVQPRGAAPHDDHFHVRIYCGEHERLQGCLNNGSIHRWVDAFDEALAMRIGHVLPFLDSPSREEVTYAITQIVRVRARQAAPHLEPLQRHKDATIAQLATDAYGFLRGERTPPQWAHLTEEDVWE
jgi:penicillin-insensitive murein DD-endopeptidase